MFECKRCQLLEARIDKLIADAAEERKLVRDSVDRERAAYAAERSELLTRIQAWNPKSDETPSDVPPSRGTHVSETIDGSNSQEELNALGLVYDADANLYYDIRLNPPAPYETVEDCKAMRKFLVSKGLPENAHPAIFDEGLEASITAARDFEKESTKED